jgi:hypothetical protein
MYNNTNIPVWVSSNGLYARLFDPELRHAQLWVRLPQFRDLDNYLSHPPNYVFVLFGLLLVVSGWLWQRRATHLVGGIWAVFLAMAAGILTLAPPVFDAYSSRAYALLAESGTVEGASRVAKEGESEEGLLMYISGAMVPAGSYEVKLEYESSGASNAPAATWSVDSYSEKHVAGGNLPPSTANGGTLSREFSLSEGPPADRTLEIRVWYPGHGTLRVEQLTITPLSLDPD